MNAKLATSGVRESQRVKESGPSVEVNLASVPVSVALLGTIVSRADCVNVCPALIPESHALMTSCLPKLDLKGIVTPIVKVP
jgi:hypothetical protein